MRYSDRPGAPKENLRETSEGLQRELEAARRDRPKPEKSNGLVQLGLEEVESWPPGTTRLVGDDYPFEVKLSDGTWLPIPAPSSGGGGAGFGVIGTTEAYSEAFRQDTNAIEFNSWTFTQHPWPGGGGPELAEVTSGGELFDPVDPGWYSAHASLRLFLTGPVPPFVTVELNGQSATNRDATTVERFELVPDSPYTGSLIRVMHTGNFYHPGPGVSNHFLGLLVGFPSTPGLIVSSANVYYTLDRVF